MNNTEKPKIYIDGQAGTTGLTLHHRLAERDDLELLSIEEELRHDKKRRQELMEEADLVFLCLPDDASIEASYWLEPTKKVIDTSSAHRTLWEYGLSDLEPSFKEKIHNSKRVSNPGCHATGVNVLLYPLVASGLLKKNADVSCFSLTGYSGGGKKMIEEYRISEEEALKAPRAYSLDLNHKHLKEIKKICKLDHNPTFLPVVDDFYSGLAVFVPINQKMLKKPLTPQELQDLYRQWYEGSKTIFVKDRDFNYLSANRLSGKDDLEIYVLGNDEQIILCAVLDNLGKGACGAAIQNMNIMLGLDETKGLNLLNQVKKSQDEV